MQDSEKEKPKPEEQLFQWSLSDLVSNRNRAFDVFEEVDIKNLLNEEVEKSRNLLLLVSAVVILLCVVTELSISFPNISFVLEGSVGEIGLYFALAVVVLLGAYYILNAESDRVAKMAKTYRLKSAEQQFVNYLDEFDHTQKERFILDDYNNKILEKYLQYSAYDKKQIEKFSCQFSTQAKLTRIMPLIITACCILLVWKAIDVTINLNSSPLETNALVSEEARDREVCLNETQGGEKVVYCFNFSVPPQPK